MSYLRGSNEYDLLNAVFKNDIEKVRRLLDDDPKLLSDANSLGQAIGWSRKEVVRLIIERGADLNKIDKYGNHPLDHACNCICKELFHDLVRHGSNPSRAAHIVTKAASRGRLDVLRYLREKGFNMNDPNERALEGAIGFGSLDTVRFLLDCGVDASGINISKPLKPWKGVRADKGTMEEIRMAIQDKQAQSKPTDPD